ncbi:hypothetical protein BDN71DRAFT_1448916 [Pleurotus eryngii]|uniref:Uncharacterized protein n=1 Tax=Pleurotus eryngii TaxID=5323 RepID=A0A9P6D696_PLEER|nr:hypothetical protein BDN71DRAFT_1448916 [Pleurotus eryngii]
MHYLHTLALPPATTRLVLSIIIQARVALRTPPGSAQLVLRAPRHPLVRIRGDGDKDSRRGAQTTTIATSSTTIPRVTM